ncbi:MAG TPA: NAD(P)/FAD-dependent oxidoreductase [Sulfurovum sp.]|uniref:flavin monoamine oxidase family protein n=1 Tax=Sulfurovum sp. TaxID=1969726 RepID=UPI002F927B2F
MEKKKLLIIGAGLSGLYSAVLLQERYEVTVLEARGRTGGRVMAMGGHDMGPSWVWGHQKNILQLIESLGLALFPQYTHGAALYDAPEGVQRFHPSSGVPSYRVKGGIVQIAAALEKRLHKAVHLNEKVLSLTESGEKIVVKTATGTYEADRVIVTLPPRLAAESLAYAPALPSALQRQLQEIPTWMGYAAKCVIEYPEAFWREEGLSGFAVSHLGPLSEIHDACTENKAALFGFVHTRANRANNEALEAQIITQLKRLYGIKAGEPSRIYLVDWKKEDCTSTPLDAMPLSAHPAYGFAATHFNDRLLFSGTESAFSEGGYLEGAVVSAVQAARSL